MRGGHFPGDLLLDRGGGGGFALLFGFALRALLFPLTLLFQAVFELLAGLLHVVQLFDFAIHAALDHLHFRLPDLGFELPVRGLHAPVLELEVFFVPLNASLHFFDRFEQSVIAILKAITGGGTFFLVAEALSLYGFEGGVDPVPKFFAMVLGKFLVVKFTLQIPQVVENIIERQVLFDPAFDLFQQSLKLFDVLFRLFAKLLVQRAALLFEIGKELIGFLLDVVGVFAQDGPIAQLVLHFAPKVAQAIPVFALEHFAALDPVLDLFEFSLVGFAQFIGQDHEVPLGLRPHDQVAAFGLQIIRQEAFGYAQFAFEFLLDRREFYLLVYAPLVHNRLINGVRHGGFLVNASVDAVLFGV